MGFDISFDISVLAVFAQGLLSFFSPCVLPLLPLYAAYLSGGVLAEGAPREGAAQRSDRGEGAGYGEDAQYGAPAGASARRVRLLVNTLFFVIGISAAFFLLGLGVNAVSDFFAANRRLFAGIGGAVIILFGLYQLGIFGESEALSKERRLPFDVSGMAMSPLTALIMGFLFSFSWTPCVGPLLSSVLIMAAGSSSKAAGFALIGVYTLGFCLPFLALGLFSDRLLGFFKRNRDAVKHSAKIGGAIMLAVGVLMLSGGLDRLSSQLADSGSGEAYEQSAEDAGGTEAASGETDSSGNKAPCADVELLDQYGEKHKLSDYEGKIVFLNFWATWCPPCRAEMPYIQAVYEEYQEKEDPDVVFLGVAFPGSGSEGDAEYISKFLSSNGYSYPVLMDEDAQFAEPYRVSAIPTTYMINADGEVYGYVTGGLDKAMIELIIDQTRDAGKPSGE